MSERKPICQLSTVHRGDDTKLRASACSVTGTVAALRRLIRSLALTRLPFVLLGEMWRQSDAFCGLVKRPSSLPHPAIPKQKESD
ncbi:hypothetical protein IEO21_10066 [Rhodonia placenta]|uniref:Uncharacterized protein n=1 Tax=Rhodonia placenta TaxID=104341 RepID=A0A8H7NT54_9APHY|nr:hypothetical protein IEO21_10066 [Postia placenta]